MEAKEAKRKGGRPKREYPPGTAEKVAALAQYGLPHDKIAIIIDVPDRTMRKAFAKELKKGHALASAAIGRTLYQKAMDGDTASLIFWAKTQLGWSEARRQVDIVSSDKSMSPAAGRAMTEEELDRVERLCDRMKWDEGGKDGNVGDKGETGRLLS